MTAEEATVTMVDALASSGVQYMLVGSFSSSLYGIPRLTKDADFVIELAGVPISAVIHRLGPDLILDPQMSFETVTTTTRYIVRASDDPFSIELFLLSADPHDRSRFARRRNALYLGRQVCVPSPEDVIVTKLRWALVGGRKKDEQDVRNVIAVQGDTLDWDYIHGWCEQHGTRELLDRVRRSIPPL